MSRAITPGGPLTEWELRTLEDSSLKDCAAVKEARMLHNLAKKQFSRLVELRPEKHDSYSEQLRTAHVLQRSNLVDEIGWRKFKRILEEQIEDDTPKCPHCGGRL